MPPVVRRAQSRSKSFSVEHRDAAGTAMTRGDAQHARNRAMSSWKTAPWMEHRNKLISVFDDKKRRNTAETN